MYNSGIWEPSEEYAKWLHKTFSKAAYDGEIKKQKIEAEKEKQIKPVLKPKKQN